MSWIRIIRDQDFTPGPAETSTEKWPRRLIDVDDRITITKARNKAGAISAWHHHGQNTTCVYVLRGTVRIEWGPDGRETADVDAGDFYFIAPNAVHRESNPGSDDQMLIAFITGEHPRFINVDEPEPEPRAGQKKGAIRVIRARNLKEGPESRGMTRRLADVDEGLSLAEARNEPQTLSGWHHHGEGTTCVYLAQGNTRLEWGAGGRESADLTAGDCYVIYPQAIHREGNPGPGPQLIVGFYLGEGPRVVNVDGPGAQ
jgi:uncharacterized RmlC-like cupin family protein